MTFEHMKIWPEVWPVAADDTAIWLVSGLGQWSADEPVRADSSPHWDAERVLADHGAASHMLYLHQTSARTERPRHIVTYMAVLDHDGDRHVPGVWENAIPVVRNALVEAGPSGPGPTIEEPQPRYLDVLVQGIRHLAYLVKTDAGAREALGVIWQRHLAPLEPMLAVWYETPTP